jgi:beta-lactamase class A
MKNAVAAGLVFSILAGGVFVRPLSAISLQYVIPEAAAAKPLQPKWEAMEKDILRSLRDFRGNLGLVVRDLSSGLTMVHDADKPFPSASMVKLPIMVACFKAAAEGRISLQDVVRVTPTDKARGSGSLRAEPSGTPVTVEKLIELMVTSSDNTAANMLIDLLGYDYLGLTFKELGMEHTNLSRKMMDFRSRRRGIENYTTPRDMADLLERIYRGTCVSPEVSAKCLAILKAQRVNDRIPRYLPRKVCVAHKTGLENKVCHDAGIIFAPKGDVLVAIFTEGDTGSIIAKRMIGRIAARVYSVYK